MSAVLALEFILCTICNANSSESYQGAAMDGITAMQHGGTIKIVTFGTSLTNQNDWQKDLGKELSVNWNTFVKIEKVASGGKTSRWGLENIPRVVDHRPDLVLIEFIINDSDIRHQLWLKESLNNHTKIIDILKRELPNAKIYLMTMSPALGIRRWLLRPFIDWYNTQYHSISKFAGVGLIDIAPMWNLPSLDLSKAIPDGVHPTRESVLQITVPTISRALLVNESVR